MFGEAKKWWLPLVEINGRKQQQEHEFRCRFRLLRNSCEIFFYRYEILIQNSIHRNLNMNEHFVPSCQSENTEKQKFIITKNHRKEKHSNEKEHSQRVNDNCWKCIASPSSVDQVFQQLLRLRIIDGQLQLMARRV